jgi:hypothetical protein
MTYNIEIMLRGNERVITETLSHPRPEAEWNVEDVTTILTSVLQVVDGAVNPEAERGRPVSLRGMSWIVSPFQDAVVIAFEIHSASVVAGPFRIDGSRLDGMVTSALASGLPSSRVH